MHQPNDRSAKWLVKHHGDGLLKLAEMPAVESWRAVANEEVAPRRTPDGLLEVKFADHPTITPVIVEVESGSSSDNLRQLSEDLFLVRLTHGVWPDAILLTLTGPEEPGTDDAVTMTSAGGTSGVAVNWRTVRLWELDADDLFALGDVGVVPLIPLARSTVPPAELLARCRAEIDRNAPADQRTRLLVISRLLAGRRYNNQRHLLDILLERRVYTESPEFTEMVLESQSAILRETIVDILQDRFVTVPAEITDQLTFQTDLPRLKQLRQAATMCPDLQTFAVRLRQLSDPG